ncbi:hypothetical protein Bhyg_02353, partial [Pseudolycoriella hygida]
FNGLVSDKSVIELVKISNINAYLPYLTSIFLLYIALFALFQSHSMAVSRSTPNVQFAIYVFCMLIFSMAAVGLFISGGILYIQSHHAKSIHVPNSCEVIESSYYKSRCIHGSKHKIY